MIRVGLTGGIASGKTRVGAMFVELGCRLIDSDQITRDLLENDVAVHAAVVEEFGEGVLNAHGQIDRRKLGEVVFSDAERRESLTKILHPIIFERQQNFLEECAAADPQCIAIVDAALMVETGNYRRFQKLIVVTCTPAQQRERLRERGLRGDAAQARIAAQMPLAEKAAHADFVVDNSGSFEDTRRQVHDIHRQLQRLSERAG